MRECVKDKETFTWSESAQTSFDEVKQLLVSSSALALYDASLRSVISTDACDYGLGAVFTQIQPDGTEKPVAFASHHQALTTLLTTKGMNRAGLHIARWSARLLCFDYDVIYKPGSQNYTADCLSRLPLHVPADPSTDGEPELVALISSTLSSLPVPDFESACSLCLEMVALREQISRGWPPSIRAVAQNLMPYYKVRDELSVLDHYIFRGSRLLVPVSLRHTLVMLAHESHQGIVRTKQRLRDLYWWPGMDTQWPELAFCPSATTDSVLDFLNTVFSRHGNPESIVTDNGTQFTSAVFAEFLKTRGIQHNKTSVYYPAASGAIERFHRALKGCIQTAILQSQLWKDAVISWLQVYRATPHATTSTAPYELLYGRKMRTRLDILPIAPRLNSSVRDNVERKQAKMKRYTDIKRHACIPSFAQGERVRVRIPRLVPKAHPRFSGLLTVEKRVSSNTFLLSDGKRWNATHLARSHSVPESRGQDGTPTHTQPVQDTSEQPRLRSKPKWHKDYVM
ncbi:immune-associated nucleotide-binding protein 9-like [Pimephales promelas]|nr:immune-associated nucleotide-binding protein 9-like [Pimephales promelas]